MRKKNASSRKAKKYINILISGSLMNFSKTPEDKKRSVVEKVISRCFIGVKRPNSLGARQEENAKKCGISLNKLMFKHYS